MYIHVVHVVHVCCTCEIHMFFHVKALLQASAVHVQHDTTSNYVVHYNMRQCLIDMTEKYHRNSCACVRVCVCIIIQSGKLTSGVVCRYVLHLRPSRVRIG